MTLKAKLIVASLFALSAQLVVAMPTELDSDALSEISGSGHRPSLQLRSPSNPIAPKVVFSDFSLIEATVQQLHHTLESDPVQRIGMKDAVGQPIERFLTVRDNADGSRTITPAAHIDYVSISNIRPAGASSSYGGVTLQNVNLMGSTIVVRPYF